MFISDDIISAIVSGNVKLLKEKRNELSQDLRDCWGNNPLAIAALNNQVEVAKWLIKNKVCNLSDVNSSGWNALTLAANMNSLEILQLLLEQYSNPSEILSEANPAGFTLFLAAAMGGAEDVIIWLLQQKPAKEYERTITSLGKPALVLAAINNHIKIIQILCSSGFSVEAATSSGRTSIIEAALNGKLEAVKCLISKNASLLVNDGEGWDAITLAANRNHIKVVQYIARQNTSYLTKTNNAGLTPLLAASMGGAEDVIAWLVKILPQKEIENEKTKEGKDALDLAKINHHTQLVEILNNSVVDHQSLACYKLGELVCCLSTENIFFTPSELGVFSLKSEFLKLLYSELVYYATQLNLEVPIDPEKHKFGSEIVKFIIMKIRNFDLSLVRFFYSGFIISFKVSLTKIQDRAQYAGKLLLSDIPVDCIKTLLELWGKLAEELKGANGELDVLTSCIEEILGLIDDYEKDRDAFFNFNLLINVLEKYFPKKFPASLLEKYTTKEICYKLGNLSSRLDTGSGCLVNPELSELKPQFLNMYSNFVQLANLLEIRLPSVLKTEEFVREGIEIVLEKIQTFEPNLLTCFRVGFMMGFGDIFSKMNDRQKYAEEFSRLVDLQSVCEDVINAGASVDCLDSLIKLIQSYKDTDDFSYRWDLSKKSLKEELLGSVKTHREISKILPSF